MPTTPPLINAADTVESTPIQTIIAADIGSVNTRAVLIDSIDGQFRLLARAQTLTTAEPPFADVTIGLNRALTEIGNLVGRQFVNTDGVIKGTSEDGSGADLFVATASGGRPMRTVLVGLTSDLSLLSGRRALNSTYIEVVATLTYADTTSIEDQVNLLLNAHPDLIFLVGGTNNGATEPMTHILEAVKLGVTLSRGGAPAVLYAGNEALRPLITAVLREHTSLYMTDNVRPTTDRENLTPAELELALAYGAYMSASIGGFTDIQEASLMGVMATVQSYNNIIRYLGEIPEYREGVICVDVGSSNTLISTSLHRKPYVDMRTDLGLGHHAVHAVEAIGPEKIRSWLSFDISDTAIFDYAWNKSLRPTTVPQTGDDLEIEYAITRELIRLLTRNARSRWPEFSDTAIIPPMKMILGAGSILGNAINPGLSALLLLDALQPTGLTRLQLDPYGVIAAIGGIAYMEPLATVQVLENGGLLDVGTAVCPTGRAPQNRAAMKVTVTYPNGRTLQREVMGGEIRTIPLAPGQSAVLNIKLQGLHLNGKRNVTVKVEGGAAGVILDARGRPFALPRKVEDRKPILAKWYTGVRAE